MIIYDYAIKMEEDGEQYYREQAEKAPTKEIADIFIMLAEEEEKHAEVLRVHDNYTEDSYRQMERNYDFNLFEQQLALLYDEPYISPREVFTHAVEMEQKSIDLYEDFLSKATDEADKTLLNFLVGQEIQHRDLFQKLLDRDEV